MKMNSDKGKFFLVLVVFIVILGFCFYKNLESNLKGYYSSRNFHGSVEITGFSWKRENDSPDMIICIRKKLTARKFQFLWKKQFDLSIWSCLILRN